VALISFVIPAFNQDSYVSRAIDSALAQSHTPVEVIVVDDGSTDGTAKVLSTYKERPNVTLIRQPNAGLSAARNRGLASSRGEFICFLDADDYLAPAFAAKLQTPLLEDPGVAFAYCDLQRVDRFGDPVDDYSVASARRTLNGDLFESLIIGGYFTPNTVLLRRPVLDALGGFDLELGGHADYDLWLRIAGAGHRAAFVSERLAFYRMHPASMSQDADHMRQTRVLALDKATRRSPARMAAALSAVQDLAVDLHAANGWLNSQWHQALRTIEAGTHDHVWSLIEHIAEARPSDRSQHKFGIWDVTIGDVMRKSVFLHPPGTLEVAVPHMQAGRLMTAVAIHPDAWLKRDAGICQFSVLVDGRVSASAVLDPAHNENDRRWVELVVDVPAATSGHHSIMLETRAVGVDWYCHALFRDVTFGWTS
jgi:GT2 family glycosyltransferase